MRRTILLVSATAFALALVSGAAWAEVINGTDGPDTIVGTENADSLYGNGGDDTISGLRSESVWSVPTHDVIYGGDGDDTLHGANENQSAQGGDDYIYGEEGNDAIVGGNGADVMTGGPGDDTIVEGPLDDAAQDSISGGSGNDSIDAASSPAFKDEIDCGSGTDAVEADPRDDISSNCETVEIMSIEEGPTVPSDTSGGDFQALGSHDYRCKIPAFGNYFCNPHFNHPPGNLVKVKYRGSNPSGVVTSYSAFNWISTGCRGKQLTVWRYARTGDTINLGRVNGDYDHICIKANVRAGSPRTIWGHYIN